MALILVCPTAFKGTLSAAAAADAMATGVRQAGGHQIDRIPLSDGGNGLLDSVGAALGARRFSARVSGPLGDRLDAAWIAAGSLHVVETAEANGLHLVTPGRRDVLRASTYGVGELLRAAAADLDDARLVVGLGGSATVDAGAGMARALGWRLLDGAGRPIQPGGAGLGSLATIESPDKPPIPRPTVLADVTNPLLGPEGAAPVFAPQKGATPRDVDQLARGLERWARIVERDLGRDVAGIEGAGAAGGLGAAFAALLDAPPVPGAAWVLDAVGFDDRLARADAVVTGEGAWDDQSGMGKVVGEVLKRADAAGVPALLVAGSIEGDLPGSVAGKPGGGRTLDERDLARLTCDGLRGLLARRGTP